jgi:hypothetical protein
MAVNRLRAVENPATLHPPGERSYRRLLTINLHPSKSLPLALAIYKKRD